MRFVFRGSVSPFLHRFLRAFAACWLALPLARGHGKHEVQDGLLADFQAPPAITAEGITRDLEAMDAAGIGGVQIFNVGLHGRPAGTRPDDYPQNPAPVDYLDAVHA